MPLLQGEYIFSSTCNCVEIFIKIVFSASTVTSIVERGGGVKEEKEVMVEEVARVAREGDMGQKYSLSLLIIVHELYLYISNI